MSLETFVNADASNLTTARCQSATDLGAITFKAQAAGDQVLIDLYLTGTAGLQNLQDYGSVRLGLGPLNARPESGTYIPDTGETPLQWNHDAADLQASVAMWGAANATIEVTAFVFKVTFDAVGAQTLPTVDAALLDPASSVNVSRLVTGDGSTKEVWMWRIFRNPIALITDWINLGDDGLTGVLNLGTTGVYDLLDTNNSVTTFIELELTDSSGNITTVMQQSYTIAGEVVGQGASGVAAFETYATSGDLAAKQDANPNLDSIDQDLGTTDGPTFDSLTLTNPLPIVSGGTGAPTAAGAKTNLGFADNATSPTTPIDTTSYTVLSTDRFVLVDDDTAGGDVTVTLPSAATLGDGWGIDIKKLGSTGDLIIDPDGTETIDGDLTRVIRQKLEATHIISDGVNWNVVHPTLSTGWAQYIDGEHTVGTPLAVNNAKVQLTIDPTTGAGSKNETYLPAGVTEFWNSTSDRIIGQKEGDAYTIRVNFTGDPGGVSDYGEIIFDIGDGAPDIPIATRTVSFAKATPTSVSTTTSLFSLATFIANGCKIYFDTSTSGDSVDIYDISVVVTRTFSPL